MQKRTGNFTASWFVPIDAAITRIKFVSDHQFLNKLLSVLGHDYKQNKRAFSENVNKTQDCDIRKFDLKISLHLFSFILQRYVHMVKIYCKIQQI